MSWPCREVSEFQDFLTHAQTVCTRPFLFLPRTLRGARLPAREKRGTGDEAIKPHPIMSHLLTKVLSVAWLHPL